MQRHSRLPEQRLLVDAQRLGINDILGTTAMINIVWVRVLELLLVDFGLLRLAVGHGTYVSDSVKMTSLAGPTVGWTR